MTDKTIDETIAPFETNITALAQTHAPGPDAAYPVCAMCMESTPLALEAARDVPKANEVDAAIHAAQTDIEALGEDAWWVVGELTDLYIETFYAACAPPAACDVCLDAARGADHGCGHTRHGEPCPVTAEGAE